MRRALVTSEAVDRLLRITDSNYRLPIAASLHEALTRLTLHHHARSLLHRATPPEVTKC